MRAGWYHKLVQHIIENIIVSLLLLVHLLDKQLHDVEHLNSRRYPQWIPQDIEHKMCSSHTDITNVQYWSILALKQTTLSPLKTKSPRYTYSILSLPRPTWHNFHKDQHNLLKCNSTYCQVHKYIGSLWYVTSQGYNQLKFQHLFHLLLLNVMRWIVHLRIQSPKQLEFISHSHLANHAAYHMLRFVNTIHKPLLVYVCISIPDTSRAVINFGLILFMLTFLICIRGDGITFASPNSTISQ